MKRTVFVLYILFLAACNDNTNSIAENSIDSASGTTVAGADNPSAKSMAGCNGMLLFKKGVEIESTTFSGSGTVLQKERSLVTEVKNESGKLVATIESTDITGSNTPGDPLSYNCKCDGNTFWVDIAPLMGALDAKGPRMDVSELAFPVNIKDGETLPDASVTVDMSMGNGNSVKTKISYKERKVDGTKKITTPAGTWNCYKITAALDMEMTGLDAETKKMMDAMKDNMPAMHSVMWYAPEIGIVQFDVYMDGELRSYSQITAIREDGSAQNKQDNTMNKLVGVSYTDSRKIKGLEGWEFREGNVVSDLSKPGMVTVDVFKKGTTSIAFFSFMSDTVTRLFTIAGVLEVKDVEQGWLLRTGLCRKNKKEDVDIVALVKWEDAEFLTNVKKAWRFSRNKKLFEEISTTGVDCISEGGS